VQKNQIFYKLRTFSIFILKCGKNVAGNYVNLYTVYFRQNYIFITLLENI
jgi:hypothetical protein